jgi:hypothetical protein
MSQTDHTQSRSEELLSASLRHLARSSPQAASPEVGATLVQAYHRHHRRRRAAQVAAITAVILAICSGSLWRRFVSDLKPPANQLAVASQTFGTQQAAAGNTSSKERAGHEPRTSRSGVQPSESPSPGMGEMFVALPSFAFSKPDEDLHVIRVEMPVSSLRLLGASVNDELITRRIVADLLVGTDGTPYAFRLVG